MLKKFKSIILMTVLFGILMTSNSALASGYTRPNSFLNLKGQERVHQIKKFQAQHNIPISGSLDSLTNNMLHNPDYQGYDTVKTPPTSGLWIVVNKTKRTLTVYKGDKVDVKFPVALGTSSTPTPSAKAKISNMAKNPAWGGMGGKYTPRAANDPLNPLGERWMGLIIPGKNGYGIHGTIKPNEIGRYVSNGCIRMFNYDIENFVFPKMKSGTPVWIGTDAELNKWGVYQYVDRVSNNPTPTPTPAPTPKPTPVPTPSPKPVEPPKEVYKSPYSKPIEEIIPPKGYPTIFIYD